MPTTFALTAVTVRYGALTAVSELDWTVSSGEVLGIIGPNGAGKSSCLAAATNSVKHSGRISLDGVDISSVPTHRLAERGIRRTFQQNAFFERLSVVDNVVAATQVSTSIGLLGSVFAPVLEYRRRAARVKAASELLEEFGIGAEYHHRRPSALPYAAQRLLSVVLADGGDSRVLMLDEPAAGLGEAEIQELALLIRRLRDRGVAVVAIEHHMDLIMNVADRIVVIDRGEKIAEGTPAEVQRDPAVLEAYLGTEAA